MFNILKLMKDFIGKFKTFYKHLYLTNFRLKFDFVSKHLNLTIFKKIII